MCAPIDFSGLRQMLADRLTAAARQISPRVRRGGGWRPRKILHLPTHGAEEGQFQHTDKVTSGDPTCSMAPSDVPWALTSRRATARLPETGTFAPTHSAWSPGFNRQAFGLPQPVAHDSAMTDPGQPGPAGPLRKSVSIRVHPRLTQEEHLEPRNAPNMRKERRFGERLDLSMG